MQKIYKVNFSEETFVASNEKVGNTEEFVNFTVEDVLIYHHKKRSQTSYFHLAGSNEMEKILFLVTQDNQLIEELGMLKPNQERTLDILEPSKQNNFVSITMNTLLKNIEKNQGDYELEIDGRAYSFRLVKGIKCRNLLERIDTYMEECENIKEYATGVLKV